MPIPEARRVVELPPSIRGFVGRTEQIQAVMDLLRNQHTDGLAIAIVGMGGVGKSSFAAEIAHLLKSDTALFPGGMTWIRCDQQRELEGLAWVYDHLLASWGRVLSGNELQPAATPEATVALREHTLRAHLRLSGQALVVLDNVEPEFPLTRAWELCAAKGMTVIVTIRHLPAALHWHIVRLDVLPPETAVGLFRARYLERGGHWEEQHDAQDAWEVVKALGYLPLAIELAAARASLRHMRPRHLAQEFRAPGIIAKLKDPTDPSVSVRFSFERSLQSLTQASRARFAACGLFDGPDWPRPVVEAAFAAVSPATETETAGDDVDALAKFSLVELFARPEEEVESFALRVRLHPLLRELAEQMWDAQPPVVQQAILKAVLEVLTNFVRVYQDNFPILAQEEALLVGMLRRVATHPARQAVRDLILALSPYLNAGGHWHYYEEMLHLCQAIDHQLGDAASEGATLIKLGDLAYNQGRFAEAQRHYEDALPIARGLNDAVCEANIFNGMGRVAKEHGQNAEAAHYFTSALNIFRAMHDQAGESRALRCLGWLTHAQGQYAISQRYYEQTLEIVRESRDRLSEGIILMNLGNLAHDQCRYAEAQAYYAQSLDIVMEMNILMHQGIVLENMGSTAIEQGRYDAAALYLDQALSIERGLSDRTGVANTLKNLGRLATVQGHYDTAEQCLEEALSIRRELNEPEGMIVVLINRGKLAFARKRYEAMLGYFTQALEIAREGDLHFQEGTVLYELGCLNQAQGRHDEAARWFAQALAAIATLEVPHLDNQIRERLAQLEHR